MKKLLLLLIISLLFSCGGGDKKKEARKKKTQKGWGKEDKSFFGYYEDIAGLEVLDNVYYKGSVVGQVTGIKLSNKEDKLNCFSDLDGWVVKISIDNDGILQKIKNSTILEIYDSDMLGSKGIKILTNTDGYESKIDCFKNGTEKARLGDFLNSYVNKGLLDQVSSDIIFCIDISSSMMAQDFTPNRLEKVKSILNGFISRTVNDRIGIVVYAGESFALCPLTKNYDILNAYMGKLGESSKYNLEDGTSIGLGIATSILRLQESNVKSKIIVLLTDGMNNDAIDNIDPLTASLIAKENNIKIYTIGVGSMGTAPYPMQDVFGREVTENIEVEIDEGLLKNIAKETGGRYFRATDGDKLLEIYNEIENNI